MVTYAVMEIAIGIPNLPESIDPELTEMKNLLMTAIKNNSRYKGR